MAHGRNRGSRRGKIAGFVYLTGQHWEALEASFQAVYNMDLTKIFTGELTLRKAALLTAQLPPGCALHREIGGTAAISDETAAIFMLANRLTPIIWTGLGGPKGKAPKPLTPPEEGWVDLVDYKADRARRKAQHWIRRQQAKGE